MSRAPSTLDLVGRAVATVRSDGLAKVIRRSIPVVDRRRKRLVRRALARAGGVSAGRRYLHLRRQVRPATVTDADPFVRHWIDPSRIERQVRGASKRWGRVEDGAWDQATVPFDETPASESVVAHFERGVPWTDTVEFEAYLERLEAGEQPKGCTTVEELEARFEAFDTIYERIERDGYRSQPELWNERPAYQREIFYKWDRSLDPRLDEITVSIGRDGALLHSDRGDHRLAIAKLLDLEAIPVLVRRRHAQWQSVRDELSAATERAELTERSKQHLEHPDVRDLHAFDASTDGTGTPL
ncbi:hypothetical protein [Natronolimnohabitans innermongolicus]|uniref:ParB-like nuclease n=1 Tax=Natronolimnohabitans innermongolicus JCM 12255 TaxID=1227499 RepID=L9X5T7_9EURY|nr:hypothetical protein [Natronolimnohabitans innermongolicus]ELY57035.1 hypothetical protein C493_09413 [Natronolimnohabitans innermongolicus JCM 12255]